MEKRVERIRIAEEAFDRVVAANKQLEASLDAFDDVLDDLALLADYYGSPEWFEDHGADEKDELPEDLECGILSEDLPYDALAELHDLALRMLEIATDTLYLV